MPLHTMILTWAFGLVTGIRHALEPDHVAAMATMVAEGHGSRRTAWLGAWWGLGHTAALLVVGVALGALRTTVPTRVERALESGVAVMLMVLGTRAIVLGVREMRRGPDAWHRHGDATHHHRASGRHLHVGRWALSPRAFLVGVVHGLAGSGALTVLAMSEFPGLGGRLLFVALFGLGSVVAMAALSGLAGWHLARLTARPGASAWLQLSAGLLSLAVGVSWF